MVPDLVSYTHSILNPLLKWLVLVLFVISVYVFYRCRLLYGGKLHQVATLLLLGGCVGILSSAFRIAGDFILPAKWAESIFFIAFAIITLVIALIVRMKFKNALALFGIDQAGGQK